MYFLLEYKANSNHNAVHVPVHMRFKFVDDLSTLEKLNLILAGLSSYNFKNHVASDIGTNQKFLPNDNILSQQYLNRIETWTDDMKVKLNVKKSKVMVSNFTEDYQFSTRLYLENTLLEIVNETKLLGTIITSDLKWSKNTEMLVKKGYQRMMILRKLYSFKVEVCDLVEIYVLYIRSILEHSCQVWHFNITEEEAMDLERVQKVAFKIILQDNCIDYEHALESLHLETLKARRNNLCLKLPQKCVKHRKANEMFPLNTAVDCNTRDREIFYVQPARTNRLCDSTIPQLQKSP